MLKVAEAEGGEVLEHLIFQLVAVDHQQHGGLVGFWGTEEPLRCFDHRESFAAALGVPDQASAAVGI